MSGSENEGGPGKPIEELGPDELLEHLGQLVKDDPTRLERMDPGVKRAIAGKEENLESFAKGAIGHKTGDGDTKPEKA